MTRVLQIVLGITVTADNFDLGTREKFSARYPKGIQQQEDNDKRVNNVYAIVQEALRCKGYGTGAGDITLNFYDGTGNAIIRLKHDAYGSVLDLSINSTVTLKEK